jgi:hypothetical protein
MTLKECSCATFLDSPTRIPTDGGAQAYIASQVADSIFNTNNNVDNGLPGVNVNGGYTWFGSSIAGTDYSSAPFDLLYDVWVDSLGYGAQFDCNSISMTLADSSGASTFSFTIQPTDLANAPPRPIPTYRH